MKICFLLSLAFVDLNMPLKYISYNRNLECKQECFLFHFSVCKFILKLVIMIFIRHSYLIIQEIETNNIVYHSAYLSENNLIDCTLPRKMSHGLVPYPCQQYKRTVSFL